MNTQSLAGITAGETARVREICCQGILRSRLLDIGLIPGTPVVCVQQGAGIAAYRIRGAVVALRDRDAVKITVE